MATQLQTRIYKSKLDKIRQNKKVVMKDIILKAGGSLATANRPKTITNSVGWEELKNKYADDEKALLTLNQLADEKNDDKDNRLKSSIEILKLNDRYPKQQNVIVGLFNKIESIEE